MNLIWFETAITHWTLFARFDDTFDAWLAEQMAAHCRQYFVEPIHIQTNRALGHSRLGWFSCAWLIISIGRIT